MKKLKSILVSVVSFVIISIIPLYMVMEQILEDDIMYIKNLKNCSVEKAKHILERSIRWKLDEKEKEIKQTKKIRTKIYVWYLKKKLGVLLSL